MKLELNEMNWTQKNDFLFVKAIPLTTIAAAVHSQLPFEAWFVTNNLQIYLDVFPTNFFTFLHFSLSAEIEWAKKSINFEALFTLWFESNAFLSNNCICGQFARSTTTPRTTRTRNHYFVVSRAVALFCRPPHTHLEKTFAQSTAITATRKPFLKLIHSLFHKCDVSSAVCWSHWVRVGWNRV